MTRAAPKVAAYPFTTLEPVLGTLDADDRQLVVADIPGLIEGASDGAGLGHDFLAHVERTRLLVHVLDLAPLDGSDPVDNYRVIERELADHDPRLAALPRILALSKADLVTARGRRGGARDGVARARRRAGARDLQRHAARASTSCARELLRRVPVAEPRRTTLAGESEVAEFQVFRPAAPQRVRGRARPATARSASPATRVERLIARHDLENEEALAHVEHRLRRMGVIRALEEEGFEPGDDVEIAGDRLRARPRRIRILGVPGAMPVAVVKLGSSIVAEDNGELRLVRRRARSARRSPRCTAPASTS